MRLYYEICPNQLNFFNGFYFLLYQWIEKCSISLYWTWKIPEKVMEKGSKTWNKGMVWIEGAEKEVVEAYAEQSEKDLVEFLKCRKEEIVVGGLLFMLMGGRPVGSVSQFGDPDSSLKHPFTSLMDQAWQDLVDEVIRAHDDVMLLLFEPFFMFCVWNWHNVPFLIYWWACKRV